MQDEIDLRPYVNALLRFWWLIALSAAVIGAVVYFIASLNKPVYQATTLVAFLEPTEAVQFDPRFATVQSRTTLLKSLPDLSKSDQMLGALLEQIPATNIETVQQLREVLSASSGSDLNLLYLRAQHPDAETAAQLVNQWAELFVSTANDIYAGRGSAQLDFYTAQLADARDRLEASQQALADFQAENRLTLVTNELDSLNALHLEYSGYADSLAALRDTVALARAQEAALPGGVPGAAGELTTLALQARALNLQETLPFFIQFPVTGEAPATTQEQVQYLNALEQSLDTTEPAVARRLAEMEPRILELQREKEELAAEAARLTVDRDLGLETYMTLVRKLDEERLTTGDASTGFRQVSRAAVPEGPVASNRNLALLSGALLGAVVAALVIIFQTWRHGRPGAVAESAGAARPPKPRAQP